LQPSSRFAVAVHALALSLVARAEQSGRPVTSEEAAAIVGAHPVHVRRVLGALRDASLVTSQPGPKGGWLLARTPDSITLWEIYRAVETEPTLTLPSRPPEACCRFAPGLPQVLEFYLREAERAVEERWSNITLAEVIAAARGEPADDSIDQALAALKIGSVI
jgi:Rrf2 family protein